MKFKKLANKSLFTKNTSSNFFIFDLKDKCSSYAIEYSIFKNASMALSKLNKILHSLNTARHKNNIF